MGEAAPQMGALEIAGGDAAKEPVETRAALSTMGVCLLSFLLIAEFITYIFAADYTSDVSGQNVGDAENQKHVQTYYPFYMDVHVMIFIGFGFLMMFLKKYGNSSVAYNFCVAANTVIVALLLNDFFKQAFKGDGFHKIELNIESLIHGDFAAGAVLISMGAVLGKTSLEQLLIMMNMELIFWAVNENIFVQKLECVDMGGSIVVHTFGAYFGLGVSYIITDWKKLQKYAGNFGATETSDKFAMIGTIFLWMYWPSFNGALASGTQQHRVVINTVLALSASCQTACACSTLLRKGGKLSMVDVQNATLAGGIAVGSSADLVISPAGAIGMGVLGGLVSTLGYVYVQPVLEKKFGLHDTCGVHNLHGMPGLLGAIGGAVSAAAASDSVYGAPLSDIFGAMKTGRTKGEQGGFQILALLVTLGMALGGGMFTGFCIKQFDNAPHAYADDAENWAEEENDEAPLVSVA